MRTPMAEFRCLRGKPRWVEQETALRTPEGKAIVALVCPACKVREGDHR